MLGSNVLKYMCRWKTKNGLQDLKKAMWYLTHLINKVEAESKKPVQIKYNRVIIDERYKKAVFDNRRQAEEVLSKMGELIDQYGCVTIADLLDLVGEDTMRMDKDYGWTNLADAEVVRVDDKYRLKLPRLSYIMTEEGE